jgi:hypothetical protein
MSRARPRRWGRPLLIGALAGLLALPAAAQAPAPKPPPAPAKAQERERQEDPPPARPERKPDERGAERPRLDVPVSFPVDI